MFGSTYISTTTSTTSTNNNYCYYYIYIPVERVPGTWDKWGILVGMDCTNHALQWEEDDVDAHTLHNNTNILKHT